MLNTFEEKKNKREKQKSLFRNTKKQKEEKIKSFHKLPKTRPDKFPEAFQKPGQTSRYLLMGWPVRSKGVRSVRLMHNRHLKR